jgi:stage II sporulation protein D
MRFFLSFAALLAVLSLMIPAAAALALSRGQAVPLQEVVSGYTAAPPSSQSPSEAADESSSAIPPDSGPPVSQNADRPSSSASPSVSPSVGPDWEMTSITILDRGTQTLHEVDMLDYVCAALASEMPPTFHEEALAAQAVAAHSYALYCAEMQREYPDPLLEGAVLSVDMSRA